ncbi:HAD family hydrolase [Streptomyces canus]|uniref:HAD family hydrolase n=1 Tax=Streptomyces canus TaxID=58343 RepID=UPI0027824B70|nr:HAD family hydrolase [Streptomyces canus]MDQ0765522.1 FMN phosphatase YigB (HAD superfamily) [Streptomyces canus]
MSLPTRIEAVFFDIGGPVYDDANFATAVLTALDEIRAERGEGPADRDRFTTLYDETRARQGGSLRGALSEEFLDGRHERALLHERTRRHWIQHPGTLYADVLPCLRALHGRVRTGVIANQEAGVVDALTRDGVTHLIDVWGVSALVGKEKPDPELFHWALDKAGVAAGQAVHVGNRLDTDVRPARSVGLGTVWVLRGEAPPHPTPEQLAEPDLAVDDLTGLAQVLLSGGAS